MGFIKQEDINNAVDFLEMMKSKNGEIYDICKFASSMKIRNVARVVPALKELSYIEKNSTRYDEKILLLDKIEPINARRLIEKAREINSKYYHKQCKNKVKPTDETSGYEIESVKSVLLENAVITLAGYKISGNFSIEEIHE